MDLSIPVDPLADVRRLYRQACLHQIAGEESEAGNILRFVLPARIVEIRETFQADDTTLQEVFSEEHRRVRDAHLFSEVMLPRLKLSLGVPVPVSDVDQPARPRASPKPDVRSALSGPQTITDMLDTMLAQDSARTGRR